MQNCPRINIQRERTTMEIQVGLVGNSEVLVDESNTAKAVGSGGLEVFATPAMIAQMEKAAMNALNEFLPEGSSSVGTMINVKHIAATPLGMKVTAQATLVEVNEKRLLFKVEAFDEKGKIGEGDHERYIINIEKFMTKVNSKRA